MIFYLLHYICAYLNILGKVGSSQIAFLIRGHLTVGISNSIKCIDVSLAKLHTLISHPFSKH